MNLSEKTIPELNELLVLIQEEITNRKVEDRKIVLAEIKQMAKTHGFSLEELIAADKPPKIQVRVKYRNPHKIEETWTGRGKRPKWVAKWLEDGGKIEELLLG